MITISDKWNKYLRKENDEENSHIKSEDIMAYCKKKQIKIREMPNKQIKRNMSIFLDGCVFCGMYDIFAFIKAYGINDIVPDTYPEFFSELYKRNIQKVKYQDMNTLIFPYFVKSTGNDKSVNGTIVNNIYQLANLICSSFVDITANLELYVAEVVKFSSEYRLLVGNNLVYGVGYQKGKNDIRPDDDFVKKIINLSNEEFLCVDVGFIKSLGEWAIIEVNPPFSIIDYGIPVDAYVDYAMDFWKKVNSLISEKNTITD
jgi:hypothetical protein